MFLLDPVPWGGWKLLACQFETGLIDFLDSDTEGSKLYSLYSNSGTPTFCEPVLCLITFPSVDLMLIRKPTQRHVFYLDHIYTIVHKYTIKSFYHSMLHLAVVSMVLLALHFTWVAFCVSRFTICHKTEVIKNNLNPVWQPFTIPVRALCNGDYDRWGCGAGYYSHSPLSQITVWL